MNRLLGKRILLVEDNPDEQRLYLKFLLDEGADVTLDCNGFSASRQARKSRAKGQPFDAAIIDLYLHLSDGMMATRDIVADDESVAIIAITANGSPELADLWVIAGATDYLEKPIMKRDVLVEAVVNAIENKQSATVALGSQPGRPTG